MKPLVRYNLHMRNVPYRIERWSPKEERWISLGTDFKNTEMADIVHAYAMAEDRSWFRMNPILRRLGFNLEA